MFFDVGCDVPRAGKMMVGRKKVMEGSIVGAAPMAYKRRMTWWRKVIGFPIVAAEVMM